MPADRPSHGVVPDGPELLEALAVPVGSYLGVATCRPVPGATSLAGIVADLLCGLGKTEVLTRRGRAEIDLVEVWMRAYEVDRLFVVGADGLSAEVWSQLSRLGDRWGVQVVFVSSEPTRWAGRVPGVHLLRGPVPLAIDPVKVTARPTVGAALPEVGFPALPAACAELLDAKAAERAQAIYDDCLAAAFTALPIDRLLSDADADYAFGVALSHVPNLDSVPLATHAVRAAGLLRGYDIAFHDGAGSVAFDALLTADRLAQLSRLVSPPQVAAGVLAGLPQGGRGRRTVSGDGRTVDVPGTTVVVPAPARPLLRAWAQRNTDASGLPLSPPRPADPRHRLLWRRPLPERLGARCQAIACRPFRRITDPPMSWARPRHGR